MTENVRRKASEVKEEVKERASRVASDVKQQAASMAEQRKGRLADQVHGVAEALRATGQKLHEDQNEQIAPLADAAAERIDGIANYVREHDLASLYNDVNRFARRHPELIVGGALLLGFALARFLKASGESAYSEADEYDYEEYDYYDTGEEPGEASNEYAAAQGLDETGAQMGASVMPPTGQSIPGGMGSATGATNAGGTAGLPTDLGANASAPGSASAQNRNQNQSNTTNPSGQGAACPPGTPGSTASGMGGLP
jgi:hypothetical protein